jgi:hypothetical protein
MICLTMRRVGVRQITVQRIAPYRKYPIMKFLASPTAIAFGGPVAIRKGDEFISFDSVK